MPATITIRDESTTGTTLNEFVIEIPDERMTVRELIRSRVYQEVKEFNARTASKRRAGFPGLVAPTEEERALNNDSAGRKRRQVDWHRQFERAVAAVRADQILILIDDRQVESLDDEIDIRCTTRVSFLRLTPLAGG